MYDGKYYLVKPINDRNKQDYYRERSSRFSDKYFNQLVIT